MAENDRYANINALSDPARSAKPIVPSDSIAIDQIPKSIYVGTAGDLVCRFVGDTADVTVKAPQGVLPFRLEYVRATGTTADDLLALY